MTALGLAALLLAAAPAGAAGKAYADLRPLIGTWDMQKDCPDGKQSLIVTFVETKVRVEGRIADAAAPEREMGTFTVEYNGSEGHYRTSTMLPDNPVLKNLGLTPLPGAMVVSTDEDDAESIGHDYINISSVVGPFTAATTVKLRRGGKATFVFKNESPRGKSACRGSGRKRRPAKAGR